MRIPVAIAAAAALGLALAGCSNSEEPSTVKGTNPTVITGDQGAPGGQVEGHDGEEGGGAGEATAEDEDPDLVGELRLDREAGRGDPGVGGHDRPAGLS